MGKKLFFLSLIVLSVAMGVQWQKNRPKTRAPSQARARVALNLQDLQLQDQPTGQAGSDDAASETGEDAEGGSEDGGQNDEPGEGDEDGEPKEPPEDASESTTAADTTSHDDPILLALKQMKRNPFERSPYAKLVEDLQKKEEIAALPVEKKSVMLLPANFSATIQTRKELVAVIDSRLYRKGELFQNKKILDIKAEIVSLESGPDTFLIPKSGVDVSIAEDGTYTVVDNFRKN